MKKKIDLPAAIMLLLKDMYSTGELTSCPTVRLSDIKKRRFHICDKLNPCNECLAAEESDGKFT